MQFILLELALEKSFTGEFDIIDMDEVSSLCYREEISRDYLFLWRTLLYVWKLKRDQIFFFSFCFHFSFPFPTLIRVQKVVWLFSYAEVQFD